MEAFSEFSQIKRVWNRMREMCVEDSCMVLETISKELINLNSEYYEMHLNRRYE
jgi:hypothetical protein